MTLPSPPPPSPTAAIINDTPGPGQCHAFNDLPDPACTPGAIDQRVTQTNIRATICVSGYTRTVRPPTSYTNPLKLRQMGQYGFSGSPSNYEEDHLIPLELGGHPTDPRNLWPEPGASPNLKDRFKNELHAAVCAGRVTLAEAQRVMATDLAPGRGAGRSVDTIASWWVVA